MGKLEVQIRTCVCCGLTPGCVFIALYSLLLYSLLVGLASWGLSDTIANGDNSHFTSCELEARGQINSDNRKLHIQAGQTTVVVEDTTSYHCSLGLYTEELKFAQATRYVALVIDICLWAALVVASVLLLVGLCCYQQWLLVPWLFLMALDIIRGFISTLFIFFNTYGNLARIATAIFFLGLQTLHLAFWLIIIAKFQRIYNRKHGIILEGPGSQYYDARYPPPRHGMPPPSAYSPESITAVTPTTIPRARPIPVHPAPDYGTQHSAGEYGSAGGMHAPSSVRDRY